MVAECVWHGQRGDVHRARQPGVSRPRPPERDEDEHPAEDAVPRRVACEQACDLGDREHENEVEKELERGDLVLGALALGGHPRTLLAAFERTLDGFAGAIARFWSKMLAEWDKAVLVSSPSDDGCTSTCS